MSQCVNFHGVLAVFQLIHNKVVTCRVSDVLNFNIPRSSLKLLSFNISLKLNAFFFSRSFLRPILELLSSYLNSGKDKRLRADDFL